MTELFSDAWMQSYMNEWNKEPELSDALQRISFNSVIGYGFTDQEKPTGVLVVENGKATAAGSYNGQTLNWDLRATEAGWNGWLEKGLGMAGLGMAYMTGKLKFKVGDYAAMIKDPRMAGPFVKSFTVMGRVKL